MNQEILQDDTSLFYTLVRRAILFVCLLLFIGDIVVVVVYCLSNDISHLLKFIAVLLLYFRITTGWMQTLFSWLLFNNIHYLNVIYASQSIHVKLVLVSSVFPQTRIV